MQQLAFSNLLRPSKQLMWSAAGVGDKLPKGQLFEETASKRVDIHKLVKGRKVVIFGLPGAFTPICSKTHLPGFIADAPALHKKGVSEIICVSVNDPWTMSAWGKAHKAGDTQIRMLADTNAAFTKALDLTVDLTTTHGGIRSKRYAMLVDNGVVKALEVEPDGTGLTCSVVVNILKEL